MGKDVQGIISTYDKTEEARQLANEVSLPCTKVTSSLSQLTCLLKQVQTAIYSTAAIEVTAVGVGSLVAASLLDFTVSFNICPHFALLTLIGQGLLGAGALAITGLCVLPYKRTQVG